jgi:hypothetical protein
MSYRIDTVQKAVFLEGSGVLTDEEMIDCVRHLRGDAQLETGMPTLSDMRAVQRLAISRRGIDEMIAVMAATDANRGAAKAAIVASEDLQFGMARMLQMKADEKVHPEFRVFREMAAAKAWIGLD